ncbi:MAG TPA: hypothetical protein VIL70_00625 [Chthoniobacterales bacterium]
MDPSSLLQSPFAPLTLVVAPALLTNASSVLAMSTVNRMVRAHERMHGFFAKSEAGELSDFFTAQVDRVEKQAALLLRALHSIYIALAAFACATLVTLLGAELISVAGALSLRAVASLGIALGFVGVGGLVVACVNLFRATHISVLNIRDEAATIRTRKARGSIERKS